MKKSAAITFVIGALCVYLFFSISHTQKDNTYGPMINLGRLPEATVTISLPDGVELGISDDILWNRITDNNKAKSSWLNHGLFDNSKTVCVIK